MQRILEILNNPYPRRMRRAALQEIIKLGPDAREWAGPVLLRLVKETHVFTELFEWTGKAFIAVYREQPHLAVPEIYKRIHEYVDQDFVRPYAFLLARLGEPGLNLLWDMRLYTEYALPDLARKSLTASPGAARFLIGKYREGESDALGLVTMLSHRDCLGDLTEALEAAEEDLRLAALFGLAGVAREAEYEQCENLVPILVRILGSDDDRLRTGALRTLSRLGTAAQEALDPILRELDGPRPVTAMLALAGMGSTARPAMDKILEVLRTRDRRIDEWPAKELPWQGQSLEFDNLIPGSEQAIYQYTNSQTTLLQATLYALEQMGPDAQEALPLLDDLLGDADPETSLHRAVGDAMESIRDAERLAREDTERDAVQEDEFMRGAFPIPPEDYEPCLHVLAPLNSLDPRPEEIANILFKFLAQPEIRYSGETGYHDPRDWVSEQLDAIELLGEYGYNPAVPLLLEKLGRFHLTDKAVDALEKIGDASALQSLLAYVDGLTVEDSTEQSLLHFVRVLRTLGAKTREVLPLLEKHLWLRLDEWSPYHDNHDQKELCAAIAELGGMGIVPRFRRIMNDGERSIEERIIAAHTIGYLGEDARAADDDMRYLIIDLIYARKGTHPNEHEQLLETLLMDAIGRVSPPDEYELDAHGNVISDKD